ncbi:complement factor H-related protein 1-like isoform X5 [Simochromis diagramma]|uniref:complement factor H-related protein 1-like isoform X5 n=1 Tax=Simochromis diagramma TaxID=43689 RepID=UPI001A7EE8AB|nr:complement factor H-related protein 1-like isoform X5 [Simochromis diagramma]
MCVRTLGFVLVLFPGLLQAQGCDPPRLVHGNFLPRQETYSDRTTITYSCDNEYKPVVEGWWATSTCERGKWSHEPQCIDESACFGPTIPNGKYPENSNGWYEDGSTLTITCDGGFEHQNQINTTTCGNGKWSSAPVCERSMSACSAPPKIPHAVIINQRYQQVFAAGSEVQYECEDGYTAHTKKSVCIQGYWTAVPTCTSSSTSDSNNRDNSPIQINIQSCGARPNIENAAVVEEGPKYLKYQCNGFYKLAGPDTVNCYGDGSWSKLPTCEGALCVVDPARYAGYGLAVAQREYMREGEEKYFSCTARDRHIYVRCANRRIYLGRCCTGYEFHSYPDCKRVRESK